MRIGAAIIAITANSSVPTPNMATMSADTAGKSGRCHPLACLVYRLVRLRTGSKARERQQSPTMLEEPAINQNGMEMEPGPTSE
jgi:hypothetical protein